jgi:HSP20 family protein
MALTDKDMLGQMERLFYSLFTPTLPLRTCRQPTWQPLTDIYETKNSFLVEIELAGVDKEDVAINLEGDRLYVRGRRRQRTREPITAHHQMEVNYGCFERVLLLKAAISREDISACFEDGFLRITIPKALPGGQVRKIEIVEEEE